MEASGHREGDVTQLPNRKNSTQYLEEDNMIAIAPANAQTVPAEFPGGFPTPEFRGFTMKRI
jgi:hypothetical protein